MTVTVLLFAAYADALGPMVELDLAADSTVADVVRRLADLPAGRALPPRPLVAVNQSYAPYEHPVRAGDEIAVIPPVAGG